MTISQVLSDSGGDGTFECCILNGIELPPKVIAFVPLGVVEKYKIIPIRWEGGIPNTLVVASPFPEVLNAELLMELLGFQCIRFAKVSLADFQWSFERHYATDA